MLGNIGFAIAACDASTDSSRESSLSDRSIIDAAPDVAEDAGYFPPPPPPAACTGTVSLDTTFGPALVAFTPDGALDTTFGVNGFGASTYLAPVEIPNRFSVFAQRPNGSFVAAAAVYVKKGPTPPTRTDIGLVQFDHDGKMLVGGFELNAFDDAGDQDTTLGFARFTANGTNLSMQLLQSNGQVFASAVGYNPDPVESDLDDYGILFRLSCP